MSTRAGCSASTFRPRSVSRYCPRPGLVTRPALPMCVSVHAIRFEYVVCFPLGRGCSCCSSLTSSVSATASRRLLQGVSLAVHEHDEQRAHDGLEIRDGHVRHVTVKTARRGGVQPGTASQGMM